LHDKEGPWAPVEAPKAGALAAPGAVLPASIKRLGVAAITLKLSFQKRQFHGGRTKAEVERHDARVMTIN
jgi:hypothetical protein